MEMTIRRHRNGVLRSMGVHRNDSSNNNNRMRVRRRHSEVHRSMAIRQLRCQLHNGNMAMQPLQLPCQRRKGNIPVRNLQQHRSDNRRLIVHQPSSVYQLRYQRQAEFLPVVPTCDHHQHNHQKHRRQQQLPQNATINANHLPVSANDCVHLLHKNHQTSQHHHLLQMVSCQV